MPCWRTTSAILEGVRPSVVVGVHVEYVAHAVEVDVRGDAVLVERLREADLFLVVVPAIAVVVAVERVADEVAVGV